MLVGIILVICVAIIGTIIFAVRASEKAEKQKYYDAAYKILKEECLNQAICNNGQVAEAGEKLMIYLKWKDYEQQGYVFDPDKPVRIGRDPEQNDICIRDNTVSFNHCMLFSYEGGLYLKDLNSSNGTWLKRGLFSQLVTGVVLVLSGDKITVGGLTMRVTVFEFDMSYM